MLVAVLWWIGMVWNFVHLHALLSFHYILSKKLIATSKDIEPSLCNINCRNWFLILWGKFVHQIWSKKWLRIQCLLYSSVLYCNTFNARHQHSILNPTDRKFFHVSALYPTVSNLHTPMAHASYFIHRQRQLIMPTVHVLMTYECGVAVSNCLYVYSLSVLFERAVYQSGQAVCKGTDYMINCMQVYLPMGVQHCYCKGQQPLLWAGSQATRRKITFIGIPNHLIYCVIFIVNTFTNVATGQIIHPGRLWIGDPCI
jgi:hypothetical protein